MKIYIDGSQGATGASLLSQIEKMSFKYPIKILTLDEHNKEKTERYKKINHSDLTIFCLPDNIVAETMSDFADSSITFIDSSSIFRTAKDWTYGFQEFSNEHTQNIINSKRISNPGCFANGILTLTNPIKNYFLNQAIFINGFTGYSAGGNKVISKYKENPIPLKITNLNKEHGHLIEIKHHLNIQNKIVFSPSIANFPQGQLIQIPILKENISLSASEIFDVLNDYYKDNKNISVHKDVVSGICVDKMANTNNLEIHIFEFEDYFELVAVYDNLGRGASGNILSILEKIILDKQL